MRIVGVEVDRRRRQWFPDKHDELVLRQHDERYISVAICSPHLQMDVVVCHAPTSRTLIVEIESFWGEVSVRLGTARGGGPPLLVCADANARVGPWLGEVVGDVAPDPINDAGIAFLRCMSRHHLKGSVNVYSVLGWYPDGYLDFYARWAQQDRLYCGL